MKIILLHSSLTFFKFSSSSLFELGRKKHSETTHTFRNVEIQPVKASVTFGDKLQQLLHSVYKKQLINQKRSETILKNHKSIVRLYYKHS